MRSLPSTLSHARRGDSGGQRQRQYVAATTLLACFYRFDHSILPFIALATPQRRSRSPSAAPLPAGISRGPTASPTRPATYTKSRVRGKHGELRVAVLRPLPLIARLRAPNVCFTPRAAFWRGSGAQQRCRRALKSPRPRLTPRRSLPPCVQPWTSTARSWRRRCACTW